ncbi:MAG: Fur family transcriptional regulator [Phycisphaerales bacterium]
MGHPHAQSDSPPATPAREVLRRCGIRCTRQREVIYDALRASRAHPTAEQLLGLVRDRDPGMSLATVYNTLEALAEHGLARRIASPVGNGPSRYDADTSHHVHLTLADGRVLDLPDDLAERIVDAMPRDLRERMSDEAGADVGPIHVELIASGPRRAR